jgi:hypothetical protein
MVYRVLCLLFRFLMSCCLSAFLIINYGIYGFSGTHEKEAGHDIRSNLSMGRVLCPWRVLEVVVEAGDQD